MLGIIASAVAILYTIVHLLKNTWKLRNIPGPIAASLTSFWGLRNQYARPLLPTLVDLHKRYGPVVRIGPNRISVSEAASVRTIYTGSGEFMKADSYAPLRVLVNGKSVGSVIDLQDEQQARSLKRVVGSAFTISSLQEYEDDVTATLDALVQRIMDRPSFNLFQVLQCYQLDFLIKLAFNERPGHLQSGEDVLGLARPTHLRVSHWISWQAMPTLEQFIFRNPIWGKWLTQPNEWARVGAQRLQLRLNQPKMTSDRSDLLQKCIDASKRHPAILRADTIASLVNSIISAGSDTTAATLTTILYFLMKHPNIACHLRQELQDTIQDQRSTLPLSYADVRTLPYLDAVVREALRLNPVIAVPLERVVPDGGCTISERYIPGGTVVGCMALLVHLDRTCYGEDASCFRPERWLEGTKDELLAMERGLLSWGSGSRLCLGRHIADMEIKMVLPVLLLTFEMTLDDPDFTMPLQRGVLEFGDCRIKVTCRRRNKTSCCAPGSGSPSRDTAT